MDKIILIDGDILVYEIGFSVECPMYVCEGKVYKNRSTAELKHPGLEIFKRKNIGSFKQLCINLNTKLKGIFEELGTKRYKMYLTNSKIEKNFRADISTLLPYKGNRIDVEKPFYYNKIRELLVNDYKAIMINGQEADDAIGIEQYRIKEEVGNFETSYIASIDKDLKMLEGWHYHLKSKTLQYIDEEEGLKRFYGQLLKGDSTDNIPGITKLLKIKGREEEANKLSYSKPGYLKQYEEYSIDHTAKECYDYVRKIYADYGIEDKDINEIGSLLWIRRKEGEIWTLN